jgi:hypothetical protein
MQLPVACESGCRLPDFDNGHQQRRSLEIHAAHRAREAAAHSCSDSYDPFEILRYWADKDLGADVLLVEAGLLLVTDATYSTDPNPDAPDELIGWVLAATSEVFVYGISAGLAGTADDFVNTFTAAT